MTIESAQQELWQLALLGMWGTAEGSLLNGIAALATGQHYDDCADIEPPWAWTLARNRLELEIRRETIERILTSQLGKKAFDDDDDEHLCPTDLREQLKVIKIALGAKPQERDVVTTS